MKVDGVLSQILDQKGLVTAAQRKEFLHPPHPSQLPDLFDPQPAIRLIKSHVKRKHPIAIYGDYDVDGICSTAILWETLYTIYPHVFPHVPHRETEGYGLTTYGIDHCLQQGAKLIIAVDNGIVAHRQIDYAQDKGCDVIVIDHHEPEGKLPHPKVLLYSPAACAAGLSWLFCRAFTGRADAEKLSLVALATICDLVPLLGYNRSFAKSGLEELSRTRRPGLLALFSEAGIFPLEPGTYNLTPYHVGFIIGPRLNAAGRLEHAIDSLRLLCTKDKSRAAILANRLGETNRARQNLTATAIAHAILQVDPKNLPKLIFVADASYPPGIVGLVASRLTETYFRPSIVVSIGETESRGSARSIPGFHITEHIRLASRLLINVGGHAMAAGLTVKTTDLDKVRDLLVKESESLAEDLFVRKRRLDAEIPLNLVTPEFYKKLQQLAPFGLGNPTPTFQSKDIQATDFRFVGRDSRHLKFRLGGLEAIWFGHAVNFPLPPAALVDAVYQVEQDTYGSVPHLQLVIKELTFI